MASTSGHVLIVGRSICDIALKVADELNVTEDRTGDRVQNGLSQKFSWLAGHDKVTIALAIAMAMLQLPR
jgi:hypothetical protein